MYLFLETTATGKIPLAFIAVYLIGFLAAVSIGSIAWYNSKRPPGWEDKTRPDFVPKISSDPETSEKN